MLAFGRRTLFWPGLALVILTGYSNAHSTSKVELWPRWQQHDLANSQTIDHSRWQVFLVKFVVTNHSSGINRVRYQAVGPEDFTNLQAYLRGMQAVRISSYNRAEQKAFWINLYNALTIHLVVSRYPLASIRDINISPGLAMLGPWATQLFSVKGEKISLDDIQHRILRPIWKDRRAHYALTNATLGSPHLQATAYTAETSEALLERSAREFINHPRALSIQKNVFGYRAFTSGFRRILVAARTA